jgi:signal transduction histidine kinase
MSWRVMLLVAAGWLLAGVVWGAQASLAASLQGQDPALGPATVNALVQVVPWIPMTLAVIAITARFPLDRSHWRRSLPAHLLALPLVAWMANVLVVLGYWIVSGSVQDLGALVRGGAYWAAMRIHVMALVYAAIATLTQAVRARQGLRARELDLARKEGQLARARLQALTAQLRPHFLFNTLHTLGHLWRSGRMDEADGLLDRLGALFQRVQATTTELEVPLSDELDLVRDYLAIEEARFRDRLRAEVVADDGAGRCLVPPLILQPLVENAVRHGISARSSAGRLRVEARRRDGRLVLVVEDDGPGLDAPTATPGSGTGLATTRERLRQMYGDDQRMTLEAPDGGGTRIRLDVPAREVPLG